MRRNILPIVVQLLRISAAHDRQHWFPADGHFLHDDVERAICADVFRLQ